MTNPNENNFTLDAHAKFEIRKSILLQAGKLIGTKYKFGAEWTDLSKLPEFIDCSEMVENVFKLCGLKMPDGSQNQFNFTTAVELGEEKPGDLAFFAYDKNITKVYHVGILYDERIIEARAFDGRAWTGQVCLRDKVHWENWKNFAGYRSHPRL